MSGGRVGGAEFAVRVNVAADLVASGIGPVAAAVLLADRFAVSVRQGRRYVEAAAGGPMVVPEASVVFTVKLPGVLARRVRAHARDSGTTVSAVVARAVSELLSRGRREHPRR